MALEEGREPRQLTVPDLRYGESRNGSGAK